MQGTVTAASERPLSLGPLPFPPADPEDAIEPFQAGVFVDHNVRAPEDKGNFLEAVTVLAVSKDRDRVFVRFYRTGNTAWVLTDKLTM